MTIPGQDGFKGGMRVKHGALKSIITIALTCMMAVPVGMIANGTSFGDIGVLDFNVGLSCAENESMVQAGDSHTYEIEVTNTGTDADKILLAIDNPTDWAANFNKNPASDSNPIPDVPDSMGRPVNGYHTYPEIETELGSIAAAHPGICQLFSIGQSWETRDLWVMKVSDNPAVNESEPELFINGGIHAREWIGVEVPLYYLNWLVDNYGSDPQATWLVDNRQIFIAPCVNPDGLVYCQNVADWRKNRRNNSDGSYGVDLNRNWGGACNGDTNGNWGGSGASHTPSAETYCGPSAFSEPETRAMRDFILAHDFQIMITYHSYAEEVYWPWGYNTAVQTPTDAYQSAIADEFAAINGYTAMQSAASYFTTGDTDDWTYGYSWYTLGRENYPFTIELGTSFQPPQSQITPICQLNLGVNQLAGDIADNIHRDSPTITHTPLHDTSDTDGPYTVSAVIATPNGLQPGATKVFWRSAGGSWNEVVMTNTGGNTWQADIPGQPDGTWVNYYIEAMDVNSHKTASPKYAPYVFHDFFVGSDIENYAVSLGPLESRIVNLTVKAPANALPNEFAAISVIGTSQNDSMKSDSVETVTIVMPALLLVNDGNAGIVNYQAALGACGYQYNLGTPATDLSKYKIVIWATDGSSTVSPTEQSALTAFMNSGGNLYINGEDIGYDLGTSGAGESAGFYRDYLHADYIADDSNGASMSGIAGDEITDGLSGLTVSGNYPSIVNPYDGAASAIFTYNVGGNAGIKADIGTYRLVYIACEYFEGTDSQVNKNLLMDRILNWLMPQPKQHDAEATSIDSHVDGNTYPRGSQDIKATVTNLGMANESSFNARCVITELQSSGVPQTFVDQDFSNTTFPPTGWAVAASGTTGTWSRVTSANAGGTSPEARFRYGPVGIGTSRMYAGPFDTSGYTSIELAFNQYYDAYATGVTVSAQTSTDGTTWSNTGWLIVGGIIDVGPNYVTEEISSSEGAGSSTLYIGFFVTGNSNQLNYWYIDDVLLHYSSNITEVEVYNETRAITGTLNSGSSQQLTWNYGFPNEYQYRIEIYTELGTDEKASNNYLSIVITIEGTLTVFDIPVLSTPGWNFISFPLAISGPPNDILSDLAGDGSATWDVVKWYDPTTPADLWKTYRPGASNNDLLTVNNAMGLWVHVTSGGLDGFITVEGQVPVSTSIQLHTGWNLVGYPSATACPASVTLPVQADIISVFQATAPYVADYTDLASVTMSQGHAYWVHVTADCTWTVSY